MFPQPTPSAAFPAIDLLRGCRSDRRSRHPPLTHQHSHGNVGRLRQAHLRDRSCPTASRNDRQVLSWLSLATRSAASQPYSAFLDSSSITWLSAAFLIETGQGLFPPPALPGFSGTTSPSAICVRRCW